MKINNDFNVGDVIIRCRDFACKVYANFYQVTKVLDDELVIHPIDSLYTSISEDGCDILPRRDKFSDLSDECYTEEYEREYCTVKKEDVKKTAPPTRKQTIYLHRSPNISDSMKICALQ